MIATIDCTTNPATTIIQPSMPASTTRAPLLINMTGEERRLLREIRERKAQLVQEIYQLKSEIKNITGQIRPVDNITSNTAINIDFDAQPDLTRQLSSWTVADSMFVDHVQSTISASLQFKTTATSATAHQQPDLIKYSGHAVSQSTTPLDLIYRLSTISRIEGHAQTTTSTNGTLIDDNKDDDDDVDGRQRFVSNVTDLLPPVRSSFCSSSLAPFERNNQDKIASRPVIPVKPMQSQSVDSKRTDELFSESDETNDEHGLKIKSQNQLLSQLTIFDSNQFNMEAKNKAGKVLDHNQTLLTGCIAFNLQPSRGIQFLIHTGLLRTSSTEVAKFLLHQPLLSKQAIGQFLGHADTFNQQVLKQFVSMHNLTKLEPVAALRRFLSSFWLPGESQQIQRFLEPFAAHYCAQNPTEFDHEDQLFLLSYSLLMLNTLRHKPNAKAKLGRSRFMAMNRGVRRSLLKRAYESVRKEPFQVPLDHPIVTQLKEISSGKVTNWNDGKLKTIEKNVVQHSPSATSSHRFLTNNEIQGWLLKKTSNIWSGFWTKCWFVLNDRCLYYFGRPEDVEPKGTCDDHLISCLRIKKGFVFN